MSNFSNLITTTKGHQFIFDILAGKVATSPQSPFTRIVTSSAVYQMNQLEGLVTLDEIRQETLISSVSKQNQTTIEIHGKIDNSTLTAGYRLNTLGVYFRNPDDGLEHLFGAAIHQPTPEIPTSDFIFPFNGLTTTTLSFDLFATVGNADNISLNVDPASIVTAKTLELHNTDPTAHQDIRQAINAAANPAVLTQAQAQSSTSTVQGTITGQRLRQAANSAIDASLDPIMTQEQAETGSNGVIRRVSAERLRQAANAAINAAGLTNHIGTGGTVHANAIPDGDAGFMTGADKSKLDSIPANAAANPAVMSQAVAEAGTSTTTQSVTAQRLRQASNAAITASQAAAEGPMPRFLYSSSPRDLNSPESLRPGFHTFNFQPTATALLNRPADFGADANFGAVLETVRGRGTNAGYNILTKTASIASHIPTMTEPMRWFRVFSSHSDIGAWQRLDQPTGGLGSNWSVAKTVPNIWHGTSGTAAGTAEKVVTLSDGLGSFLWRVGTIVIIRFSTANTAASPTLNIAETGAENIRHAGANIGGAGLWRANQETMFVWDGTGWAIINPMTRGVMMQTSTALPGTPTIGTRPAAAANNNQIADTAWVRSRIADLGIVQERGVWTPNWDNAPDGWSLVAEYARYSRSGNTVICTLGTGPSNVMSEDRNNEVVRIEGLPFHIAGGARTPGVFIGGHWNAAGSGRPFAFLVHPLVRGNRITFVRPDQSSGQEVRYSDFRAGTYSRWFQLIVSYEVL